MAGSVRADGRCASISLSKIEPASSSAASGTEIFPPARSRSLPPQQPHRRFDHPRPAVQANIRPRTILRQNNHRIVDDLIPVAKLAVNTSARRRRCGKISPQKFADTRPADANHRDGGAAGRRRRQDDSDIGQ